MSDNVIVGPWMPKQDREPDEDEKNNLMVHALTVELTEILFEGLREVGFDNLDEMCYTKDLALVVHALKSCILSLQGRYHPLQKVAENIFEWTPDGESLNMTTSLNLEFE